MEEETKQWGTVVEVSDATLAEYVLKYAYDFCTSPVSLRLTNALDGFSLGFGRSDLEWNGVKIAVYRDIYGLPLKSSVHGDRETVLHCTVSLCMEEYNQQNTIRSFCMEAKSSFMNNCSIFDWDNNRKVWKKTGTIVNNTFESLLIDETEKDKLADSLDQFLSDSSKKWYAEHRVPYRQTYLLSGPSGSGKSTVVATVANSRGFDIYRISLQSDATDTSMLQSLSMVPEQAIVLLEDVDTFFGENAEKQEDTLVTYSGLLNLLDGIQKSSAVLFFLTTTELDALDHMLVRKGRVDVKIQLNYMNAELISSTFLHFYPEENRHAIAFCKQFSKKNVSVAELVHHFKTHNNCSAHEVREYY